MMELAQQLGGPLFNTNEWTQSSPYPVSPFDSFPPVINNDRSLIYAGLHKETTHHMGSLGRHAVWITLSQRDPVTGHKS